MPLAVLSRSLLEVSYDSLHSSSVQADILQAVIGQGILAIKSLPPSFTEAQSILAEALPLCSGGREDVMGDGTIRTTLAQVSADESPAFLRNRACPVSTVQARRDVHTTLDHVGQRVAGAMDRVGTAKEALTQWTTLGSPYRASSW
ncbi:hypothetical protein Pmar_PMAR011580 [Perkinsus marinus ATCC 50983]|uniref:Uncharacterized protein n=1 Tax=Perkinsus marinus (strain ATCC 50983 / TXsc) TaxID=423536 RepID=C5LC69_PERM5|nr:hypothetical protein Pmar_PMAR011580 [Perkinsus marinus ATCC 50983]EER05552.1 hypothetical protein Pmar_PMAR011580 [Perkinsus marinus ATCC 50983]|eukprot:XP_002773736.1 hypothetical protein Pmar_PMAR011580 [Perkinsus marinus ATCC 50983]